ncbi:MAG: sel1 repeat family protein, partial [Alphaproteobacteria bacterium]|nr:sel1 repeat family protein [Alphaproteobacteria bacterium]
KSAAESGLSIAQENLADIYLIKKDYTNALLLFSKLAETNSAKAYKTLGYLYLEGLGVTPDHNKAKEFFEKAATQNDAYSQYHLGEIYRKEANYERAHYWINKAVEHNYAQAYGSLGFMYVKGRGVEKNPLTTGKLYKKLADTNDNAMIKHLEEIEQYCVQPYAPTADHVEACLVSAGAGSADARKLLAVYYFHGQGVEKDPIESLAWGLLTPMHVPTEKKDPIAARAFGVSAHLLLTLDAESIAKAKAKSIDYRNQYATPPADLSNLTSKD